ncbi:Endonuclease IV [Alkalithermobacter thermoalcaliphilus JW-YL-7 = DSM 7308]|uniref:Probable endonuclease 4 n=1 Tax=Alkalithermobacter thermoalcaliphilus JW-YL-7 = DSM 7308 TaxID=1121328 RepID=A0A150FNW7_CLOPD|nr:endonuclease 4 [[Clostridium] paradoxum JW-YL-7 = DSM 7308]SHK84547.1 Endonuclease IV [[Clostridium] paradoxum JW-YL-7 = DSM 7308]
MIIGPHISITKGFFNAAKDALSIGANTFQFFTRNPRGSTVKKLDEKDMQKFFDIRKKEKLGPLLAHIPYTVNLASSKQDVYDFGKIVLKEDLDRLDKLQIEYVCLHPGSHLGQGIDKGIDKIASALNSILTPDKNVTLLIETMSGKGTEVGYTFEQIRAIIDKIDIKEKVGVCFDTCHVFSAGYDIVNNLEKVLKEFDNIIGLEKLKVVHLNDSMKELNSKKDRHEIIGKGYIGLDAIVNFITNPAIKDKPLFLETPADLDIHKEEIKLLKDRCM